MTQVRVLVVVAVGLILQMALARYAVAGRVAFDLVLVAVVYAAVMWGPTSGMWAGTIGGLAQDLLAGDVVGAGGLTKTVAGMAAGVGASRVDVGGVFVRVATVVAVTAGHRLLAVVVLAAIDQRWSGVSWTAMLMEILLNGIAGFVAFQGSAWWPGALRQSREMRRSSLSKRQW